MRPLVLNCVCSAASDVCLPLLELSARDELAGRRAGRPEAAPRQVPVQP